MQGKEEWCCCHLVWVLRVGDDNRIAERLLVDTRSSSILPQFSLSRKRSTSVSIQVLEIW